MGRLEPAAGASTASCAGCLARSRNFSNVFSSSKCRGPSSAIEQRFTSTSSCHEPPPLLAKLATAACTREHAPLATARGASPAGRLRQACTCTEHTWRVRYSRGVRITLAFFRRGRRVGLACHRRSIALSMALRAVTFFLPGLWGARARGCPCPLPFGLRCPPHARARCPSVPAPCPCPLPFGARPMPVPFCGPYPFATRSRCVLLLVQLLVPRRAPTRRLPLPALCSYPFATRARPMPVPSHCPCPRRARAPTPPFARSRSCACATTRPRARAPWRAARARPLSKKAKSY